jgi:diadenosine tetraphosphate (Ap4A) HIT family hydrolase
VTAAADAELPGYVCVVSKHHAVEPFDLPPDDAALFFAEAMSAARRIAAFSKAVKMNYGIHGNVIPHLHMHLWPRFPDDPYDVGGIPAHVASFARTPAQIDSMRLALLGYEVASNGAAADSPMTGI